MIFTPRRSNSGLILAMYPSSVVHTGVKSFGCENSTAQESPIQSWNLIGPSVVSASKSGTTSPSLSVIDLFLSRQPPCRPSLRTNPDRLSGITTRIAERGLAAGVAQQRSCRRAHLAEPPLGVGGRALDDDHRDRV